VAAAVEFRNEMMIGKSTIGIFAFLLWTAASMASEATDATGTAKTAAVGTKVVLEINLRAYWSDRLTALSDRIDAALHAHHIKYASLTAIDSHVVAVVPTKSVDEARETIDELVREDQAHDGEGTQIYQIALNGHTLTVSFSPKYVSDQNSELFSQSIELVRRRMQALTSNTVTVHALDQNLLEADVPDFSDVARVKEYFAPAEKLTIHLVDARVSDADIKEKHIPAGNELLKQQAIENGVETQLAVRTEILLSGDQQCDGCLRRTDRASGC
jgi:preprotein translocase subunit SecD